MRRAALLLIGIIALSGFVATSGSPVEARPRLGAVLGVLRAPLGVFGRLGPPRRHIHRYRGRAAAAAGVGAAALAGRAAWTGPVFWPAAYEDMFGYVARADDMRFWRGGFADVLAGIMAQGRPDERRSARGVAAVANARAEGTTGSVAATAEAAPCGTLTPRSVDQLMAEISDAVRPKPAQQAAVNELRAALARAADDLRGACPRATPLTPLARLGAMQQRLWAMQSAALLVRAPLAKLVATLDDGQKARLDNGPPAASARRANVRRHRRAATARAPAAPVQVCYMNARAAGSPPAEQIAGRVRPGDDQQAGLKSLAETSGNMAKLMIAACPEKPAADVLARLDAVLGRLEAMLYAINVVNPPLQNFYGSLTDEQKARFNSLGAMS